jgi:hypothetical protein
LREFELFDANMATRKKLLTTKMKMQDFKNLIPIKPIHLTFALIIWMRFGFCMFTNHCQIAFLVLLTSWQCEKAFMGDHRRKFRDFIF